MNTSPLVQTRLIAVLLQAIAWLRTSTLILLLASEQAHPQPTVAPEYALKAGFLVAFSQYTIWPDSSFTSTEAPLLICILGNNPFGDELVRTSQEQKSIHPIHVVQISSPLEADPCHIVFIGRNEPRKEAAWLADLKHKPILTVGESDQSLRDGAILAFVIVSDRVRFEVDLLAMETAKLKFSSSLLESALAVHRLTQGWP